jgi:hypothetical protein
MAYTGLLALYAPLAAMPDKPPNRIEQTKRGYAVIVNGVWISNADNERHAQALLDEQLEFNRRYEDRRERERKKILPRHKSHRQD